MFNLKGASFVNSMSMYTIDILFKGSETGLSVASKYLNLPSSSLGCPSLYLLLKIKTVPWLGVNKQERRSWCGRRINTANKTTVGSPAGIMFNLGDKNGKRCK